jgi:hypothetical protein
MALSVEISILGSSELSKDHQVYAGNLLKFVIAQGREMYGPDFLVYNVHSMMHIADDAKFLGHLDKFSAFPYENDMQKLKKKTAHSGKSPLIQIKVYLFKIYGRDDSHENKHKIIIWITYILVLSLYK